MILNPALQDEAVAGEYSVYGPRVYLRDTGKPFIETDTLTAPSYGNNYLLKISNGGWAEEYEHVSSAVITLNGTEILLPNKLNQQVDVIEREVTLQQLNELSVEVRGKPGGALVINVIGIDNDLPVITANVSPQANTAGWHNTDVTVTFDCTDALSGMASCTSPVTVTSEGAAQVVTGTAVDNAGNVAEISVTINLDKTKPVINIVSPLDGALITEPNITITGQVDDAGSQVTARINDKTVTLQTDGSFSHPATLLEGLNTLTLIATDAAGNSAPSYLSVTLQTNKPPIANDLNLSGQEDVAFNFTLSANDPDGDVLSYQLQTQPLHGVISGAAPNLVYTPNTNYNGTDNLTYLVNDGLLDSTIATVNFNVQAVNDAPVAQQQIVTLEEDTSATIVLTATDIDSTALTYLVAQNPSNGAITGIAPNLTYTPNENFNGVDSFTFSVNDGFLDSAVANVAITVSATNDVPVANSQTVSTNEDVALSITLTGSDIDGDSLNYSITTQPLNGVLSGTAPNLTYTPNNNFSGLDSILFVVSDGQLSSANAVIDINVIAVNDIPVINSQPITSITVGETYQYAVDVFDIESDPLTYSLLESPNGMNVGLVTGALIWLPTTDQLGEHAVTVQVNDGRGGTVTQSFTITVLEVPNNNPEITSLPPLQGFVNESYNYQITAQDQDGDTLSYSLINGPAGMSAGFMFGNINWIPNSGQVGSHSVTVRVDDEKGGNAIQTFIINVETGSNAAPVITSSAVINSLPGSLYSYSVVATDANGDVLSYVLTNAPTSMIIHDETGLINWTPTTSDIGSHNISLRVFDSKGAFDEQNYVLSVSLDTTENQGPSITSTPITSVEQDAIYYYDVEASDPNNDALTYVLNQAPDNMTINPVSGDIAWTANRVLPNYSLEPHTQCEAQPQDLALTAPSLKWEWTGSDHLPTYNQVLMTPVVANLTDDNDDGLINENDIPEVLFLSYALTDGRATEAVLRVVNGADGSDVFTIDAYRFAGFNNIAVADIDSDGVVEILISGYSGGLYVFEHTGELKWVYEGVNLSGYGAAVMVADINSDGSPEIILGRHVVSSTGDLLWSHSGWRGHTRNSDGIPTIVDLDNDNQMEIIWGASAYNSAGALLWSNGSVGDGFSGFGNFDEDTDPELVVISSGYVNLLESDGTLIWRTLLAGNRDGGAPTIADFDGDGQLEIGVAASANYTVINHDGSILWQQATSDASSATTGSSAFDFNNDGKVEVVYADELYLRVYDGGTGNVIYEVANTSGTGTEYPIIVDVDNDNHADIVVPSNQGLSTDSGNAGVRVYTAADNSWVDTRNIWHAYDYHIDNINDDGTVPQVQTKSWLTHNTYRMNQFADGSNPAAQADVVIRTLTAQSIEANGGLNVSIEVFNRGLKQSGESLVTLYTDASLTTALGTVSVPEILSNEAVTVQLILNNVSALTQIFAEVKVNVASTKILVNVPDTVPGTANTWLAGMPDGTTSSGDAAPAQSPVFINELDLSVDSLSFVNVTGGASHVGGCIVGSTCTHPDGASFWNHSPGAINGLSDVRVPIDALIGVFLDDSQPDSSASPETLNFQTLGTDFASLSPKLKQVFFIGDGLTGTSSGEVQDFIVPDGATRLYLGIMDGYGWYDNSGAIELEIHANVSECVEDNNLGHVYLVNVNAADPAGLSDAQIFSVQTLPKQVAPQITSSNNAGEVIAAGTIEHQVVVTDNNIGDAFSYTLQGTPVGLSISASGLISWTPTTDQVGNFTFTVIVTDLAGNQVTQIIAVNVVADGNRPPMITNQVDNPIIYAPVSPVNPNIVMHLEFEGGFNDSSAYANHAVIDPRTSGLITTIPDVGVVGDALSIQNGLGWLTVANSSSLSMTEALTMSAWINPTGKVGSNAGVFFKGELNARQPDWQIVVGDVGTGNTTGASGAAASINGTGYATSEAIVIDYTVLNPIPTGIWTHVAVTYNGEELRLYVNGILVGVDPHIDSIHALGSDLYIGNRFMPSGDVGGYQGLMDDLKIYDVALSQSEINSLMDNKVGSKFSHQVLVSDPDIGDVHQFSLLDAPEGMSIDATTGLIEWEPNSSQIGEVTFTAVVTDSMGATDQQLITLTVTTSNSAPEITSSPADVVKLVGETFDYSIEAFDPEGSDVLISLVDAPMGMTLDSLNVIQWTTTEAGVYNVVIRASDGELFSEQSFAITVKQVGADNHLPIISSTPIVSVIAGQNYQYQIDAYDPEGGDLQFELTDQPTEMQINNAGLISWLTQVVDTGTYNVVVRVTDRQGAYVEQSYILAVGVQVQELNNSPSFTSTPVFTARENKVYNYQVSANDVDGDSLSYQLNIAPNGMSIDSNNLISWQPGSVEIGSHNVTVTVSDGRSGVANQSYVLAVYENGTPVITSVPTLQIIVGNEYSYQVEAVDENGDLITFSLDAAPTGMAIDSQTGAITWTPSTTQVDTHGVVIRVTDDSGAYSTQPFSLQVSLPNRTPVITSAPQQYVYVNSLYQYQVTAEDQDADTLSFELQSGPQGMAMDATGLVSWTPTQTQIAIHQVQIRVSDGTAATIQTYQMQVLDDPEPLALWVNILPPTIAPGETTDIQLVTQGGRGYITRQLWIDGQQVALDEQGAAQVTSNVIGRHDIFARVVDDVDVQTFSGVFSVTDPSDTQPPTVSIANVNNLDVVTAPIEVVGTIQDDNISDWRLLLREVSAPQDEYILIAEGNTNTTNAPLGTFDPTLLMNGQFEISLQATDINNQISVTKAVVSVEGDLKVGNFSITFEDVNIPVAGLPIVVTRTYDTRQRHEDLDFGYGWSVGYQNMRIHESRKIGKSWSVNKYSAGAFDEYCVEPNGDPIVSITLPDGRIEKFKAKANPDCQLFQPPVEVNIEFEAIEGTTSTLTQSSYTQLRVAGGDLVALLDQGSDVDPDLYQLTTVDGYVFNLNQGFTLSDVTTPNGHSITYTDQGIEHSGGKGVTFTRDAENRITAITLPDGNVVQYEYDVEGNLQKFTDELTQNTSFTYDDSHALLDIIDANGVRVTRNEYDIDGRLIAQIDADGNRIEFTHDIDGRQEIIRNRRGFTQVFTYDDMGNVLTETNALGETITRTYDAIQNVLSETDALDNTTSMTYDNKRNKLTETNALGHVTTNTYNSLNKLLTETDDDGVVVITNTYKSTGDIEQSTNAIGQVTNFAYDLFSQQVSGITDEIGTIAQVAYTSDYPSSTTDSNSVVTTFLNDDVGNKLSETTLRTLANGSQQSLTTSYVYDDKSRLIQTTDPQGNITRTEYSIFDKETATVDVLGRRTEYDYDIRGNLIATRYPDGTSETNEYDAENNLTHTVDRNGHATVNEYDAANRLIKTTFADASFTSSEYDAAGRMTASIDVLGNRTTYGYDAAGRQIEVSDALSNITQYVYDKHGNRIQMTDAKGQVFNYEYDLEDRLVKTIYPDTTFTRTEYDARGRKISATDQAGITTRYEYDGAGRLTKVIGALTQATTYTYDEQGNKLTQTDALGRTTSWTYDEVGRVLTRTLPMGQVETFTYNAIGNVLTKTDFNNQVTTYTYDNNNRTASISYSDGTSESFTYDNNGNRLTATSVQGTWSYQYDVFNRLSQETKPTGEVLEYSYDAAGNKTQLKVTYQDASIRTESFAYDALNRLESVTDANLGVTSYGYDANGNRASVSNANGTSTVYVYDNLNRLTKVSHYDTTGGLMNAFSYTLDVSGHRTQITETNGRTSSYTYDELYRLTAETIADSVSGSHTAEYTYDAVGNRLTEISNGITTTYSYDENDRVSTQGDTSYSYDDNGNTLGKTVAGFTTSYSYSNKNKLAAMNNLNVAASYQYNIDGIRIGKVENGQATNFLVDQNRDYAQVIAELDSSAIAQTSYTYGDDLLTQERNSQSFTYHYDGLGSTRLLTNSTGNSSDSYNYEAFGELLNSTGVTENSYLYTGEQFDTGLDNYYLRARYYDQGIGRFTQQDTWMGNNSDPVTLHKYLYANGNPINGIDPTGMFTIVSTTSTTSISSTLTSVSTSAFRFSSAASRSSKGTFIAGISPLVAVLAMRPGLEIMNHAKDIASFASSGEVHNKAIELHNFAGKYVQAVTVGLAKFDSIMGNVNLIRGLAKVIAKVPTSTAASMRVKREYSRVTAVVQDRFDNIVIGMHSSDNLTYSEVRSNVRDITERLKEANSLIFDNLGRYRELF